MRARRRCCCKRFSTGGAKSIAKAKRIAQKTNLFMNSKYQGAARWPFFVVAVLIVGAAGAITLRQRAEAKRWAPIKMPERIARVTGTWDTQTLADRLKKSDKLRETELFLQATEELGLKSVAEGGYVLPEKAGPRELAQIFKVAPALRKVTFPEGFTASQIADRLAAEDFVAAPALRRLAYPTATGVSALEGRLFPDTYYLPVRGSAQNIAGRLKSRFDEVWKGLPKDKKQVPKANGKALSPAQIVVLASLVERESALVEESPLIAGVLLNRLNQKMRLQCDASVQYARMRAHSAGLLPDGHKKRLLFADLKIESPYNTYRNAGLPPGAICNPGADSLRAALMPRRSPYFFYVLSPRLKRHLFARTFDEHKRNIKLLKREKLAR